MKKHSSIRKHSSNSFTVKPGAHSLEEILSQPNCWKKCLLYLEGSSELKRSLERFASNVPWLFIGCGSSYYIALAAAASWKHLTGKPAHAIPASELLLFPDSVLQNGPAWVPVLISRSGRTSEIIKAAQCLQSRQGLPILGITCTREQALQEIATHTIELLPAAEESTVMTRSFTSMLLALQFVAASVGQRSDILRALRSLPGATKPILEAMSSKIRQFIGKYSLDNCVFLGQGPFFGIACECCLKVTEMSCSPAQCFHSLEFRHGPKSVVGPGTLVCSLISGSGFAAETKVLHEMKELGAITMAITDRADDDLRRAADLVLEMNTGLSEYAWLAPSTIAGQFVGLHMALDKGLDPDRPRNLSPVVLLED